jgi:hypothetical protein
MVEGVSARNKVASRQRRAFGGSRREASERVILRSEDFEAAGWTLNVSRGGVRIVLEDPVQAQHEYQVSIGGGSSRRGRVAWVRDEADGQIAGVQFLDVDGEVPADSADD